MGKLLQGSCPLIPAEPAILVIPAVDKTHGIPAGLFAVRDAQPPARERSARGFEQDARERGPTPKQLEQSLMQRRGGGHEGKLQRRATAVICNLNLK